MYHNITLKDLEAISTTLDICSISTLYDVQVLTNNLEGHINAVVKIISREDQANRGICLFAFRNGEQLLISGMSSDEQLIVPDDYIARLKESLSVKLNLFGEEGSIWEKTIKKLNKIHENDSNSNYEPIPTDLQIPEFKYEKVEKNEDASSSPNKPSFFKRLFSKKTKNNQENEAEHK